jgi:uncharacterized protein
MKEAIFQKLEAAVVRELGCSAHDLEHVRRVYRLCLQLAVDFPAIDVDVLQAAALLHDIARVKEDKDPTGTIDHAALGATMGVALLRSFGFPEPQSAAVAHCIAAHRYRGGSVPQSLEAKVLFDADKLDVLGAVGLARSYIITGEYGGLLYSGAPLDEYIRDNLQGGAPTGRIKDISKHAANLEYELKFKLIPERLYTSRAKALAKERTAFMDQYFQRLRRELAGEL